VHGYTNENTHFQQVVIEKLARKVESFAQCLHALLLQVSGAIKLAQETLFTHNIFWCK